MKQYPYAFHVALDGNGVNGLEGMAGTCIFLFDPADNSYAYKIKYFQGASAGHAVSVNGDATYGYLGNAGQHLIFYDASTLEKSSAFRPSVSRRTTPRFAAAPTRSG